MTNTTINEAIEIAVNEFRGIPIPTQELEDVLANYLKEALHHIAALAAAEEREACAKMCEAMMGNITNEITRVETEPEKMLVAELVTAGNDALKEATTAISARGQGNEKTV